MINRSNMKMLLLALVFAIFHTTAFSEDHATLKRSEISNIQTNVDQLKRDVKATENDIEILRRDQINYRLEKDILKEAYASNLQTINLLLSIGLGVLGVLGYLGIRNIKEIRKDYEQELSDLRQLKGSFEDELHTLTQKQKEFELKVGDLAQINEEQNRRLKVLELIEKIGTLIKAKNWTWALHWISVAQELDPNNSIVTNQKFYCLGRSGQIAEALITKNELWKLEPDTLSHVYDILEFLALLNQREEYKTIRNKYNASVNEQREGYLAVYLDSLLEISSEDYTAAQTILIEFCDKFPDEPKKLLDTWSMEDAKAYVSRLKSGKRKDMLSALIGFFGGEIAGKDYKKTLLAA